MNSYYQRTAGAGFTLIELLITVAIIAILSAIVIPSYRSYVLRSGRTEAISAVTQLVAAQERYRLDYNRYAVSLAALGFPATSENGKYTVTLVDAMSNSFVAAAHAQGDQVNDSCDGFKLTHLGERSMETGDLQTCWK